MDDALSVRFVECVPGGDGGTKRLVERKRATLKPIRERLAFDALHHHEIDVHVVADLSAGALAKVDVVQGADVRVVQTRDRPRFLLEALTQSLVFG